MCVRAKGNLYGQMYGMNWIDHRSVQEPNICQCIVHTLDIGHGHWSEFILINAGNNPLARGGIRMAKMRSRIQWRSFNSGTEFNLPVWTEIMEYVVRTVIVNSQSQHWFTDTRETRRRNTARTQKNTLHSLWFYEPCTNATQWGLHIFIESAPAIRLLTQFMRVNTKYLHDGIFRSEQKVKMRN